MANVDNSELAELAADLRLAPNRMHQKARGIAARGALEVKKRMQQDFSGHRQARGVPVSLEYQRIQAGDGQYIYEIGELDSAGVQWGLAAILAYGTSNNAPVVDHTKALRGEAAEIDRHLGDAGEAAVLGGPK